MIQHPAARHLLISGGGAHHLFTTICKEEGRKEQSGPELAGQGMTRDETKEGVR